MSTLFVSDIVHTVTTLFKTVYSRRCRPEGTRRVALIVGSDVFHLSKLISEKLDRTVDERIAVFESRSSRDGQEAIVKFRVQRLDPVDIFEDDRPAIAEMAKRSFVEECIILEACESMGHTPKYYGSKELLQDNTWPFPGGYLYVLAMSKVPGRAVTDIPDIPDLTEHELSRICEQLANTLEAMRLRGFLYSEGATDQIFYDRNQEKMYLTGFADCVHLEPGHGGRCIRQNSVEVLEFGPWEWPPDEEQSELLNPFKRHLSSFFCQSPEVP